MMPAADSPASTIDVMPAQPRAAVNVTIVLTDNTDQSTNDRQLTYIATDTREK